MKTHTILGINGSIRAKSSSHAVMNEVAKNLPGNTNFILFERLADIPAFDGSEIDPEPVAFFKKLIRDANAIIICTPEYAFGVPGALKNALDWTVGSGDFVNKPVSLITASSQGEKGHEAMKHILTAISAELDPATTLLISFIRAKVKGDSISDGPTLELIKELSKNLINRIDR